MQECQQGCLEHVQARLKLASEQPLSAGDQGALHWAALNGHVNICQALLAHGFPVDAIFGDTAGTALHWAATKGHCQVGDVLLRHGADASILDASGYSPLHIAALNGHCLLGRLILEHQPSLLDLPDSFGRTPLLWATIKGHVLTVQMLLKLGSRVDACDLGGNSILAWSVISDKGGPQLTKLLLRAGASAKTRDATGKDVLEWAALKHRSWFLTALENARPSALTRLKRRLATVYGPHIVVIALLAMISVLPAWLAFIGSMAVIFGGNYLVTKILLRGHNAIETPMLVHMQWALIIWPSLLYVTHLRGGWAFWTYPVCVALTIYFLVRTMRTDPGVVHSRSLDNDKVLSLLCTRGEPTEDDYCTSCLVRKPLRSKHCRVCNQCVARFDHHCPWTGTCIGVGNHHLFVGYLVFLAGGVGSFYRMCWQMLPHPPAIVRAFMIVCTAPTIFVAAMVAFQAAQILSNTTNNELRKRVKGEQMGNPYYMGIVRNIDYFFELGLFPTTPKWHQQYQLESFEV